MMTVYVVSRLSAHIIVGKPKNIRNSNIVACFINFIVHFLSGTVIFYCVNTSYPMDNSLSGWRRPARQTSEKDVLCFHRPGRSSAVHSPGGV